MDQKGLEGRQVGTCPNYKKTTLEGGQGGTSLPRRVTDQAPDFSKKTVESILKKGWAHHPVGKVGEQRIAEATPREKREPPLCLGRGGKNTAFGGSGGGEIRSRTGTAPTRGLEKRLAARLMKSLNGAPTVAGHPENKLLGQHVWQENDGRDRRKTRVSKTSRGKCRVSKSSTSCPKGT